jgi:hypothetical protein
MTMERDPLNEELERLRIENWQLKGALGYPMPGDVPEGNFKCGLCDATAREVSELRAVQDFILRLFGARPR